MGSLGCSAARSAVLLVAVTVSAVGIWTSVTISYDPLPVALQLVALGLVARGRRQSRGRHRRPALRPRSLLQAQRDLGCLRDRLVAVGSKPPDARLVPRCLSRRFLARIPARSPRERGKVLGERLRLLIIRSWGRRHQPDPVSTGGDGTD